MSRRYVAAGAAALITHFNVVMAQEPEVAAPEELETIHVIGEQPGPALWKVSKGDHVMWVLGTQGPLPQGVTWRSAQVEARIAESQQLLLPGGGGLGVNIGILHGLTLVPSALRAGKNPGGKKLRDVLPAPTYAKWRALREKYIGKDDDVERWRPAFALEILREKISAANSKVGGQRAMGVVHATAKAHNVSVRQLPYHHKTVRVERPRSMIKAARKLGTPDLECFTRAIDTIESELKSQEALGSAWARGDISALRALHSGPRQAPGLPEDSGCVFVLMEAIGESDSSGGRRAKKLFDSMKWHAEQSEAQGRRDWLNAAQAALQDHTSTFAVLPMIEVIRPDGYLAALRDMGFKVEAPL